jgi:hypothetical protein
MNHAAREPVTMKWGVFAASFLALLWRAPQLSLYLTSADQGYQLGLGSQVLHGKYPFVGTIFHYGPMVALTSAAGQLISPGLLPEVLICALGYTISLGLMYALLRRHCGTWCSLVAPLAGYFLLARYYKWYYWLFPLAVLYCVDRAQQARVGDRHQERWVYLAGFVAGVGTLYRFDLGIVFLIFFAAQLVLARMHTPGSFGGRSQTIGFASTFTLPIGIWLVSLIALGGWGAIGDYLRATAAGAYGVATEWSLSPPAFSWAKPLGVASGTALTLLLLPVVYSLCLWLGVRAWTLEPRPTIPCDRLLAALGIMGLGLYPQGCHRADASHVLQVIPPALIAGPLLVRRLWTRVEGRKHWWTLLRRGLTAGLVAWAILGLVGISALGGRDLAPFHWNPVPDWRALQRGLDAMPSQLPKSAVPVHGVMRAVVEATEADARILVVPIACQIYFFTNRPMSGLLIGYAAGIHDDDYWRARNLDRVREEQPAVVIAHAGFLDVGGEEDFRESHPELYRFLTSRYRNAIYRNEEWIVLAPGASGENTAGSQR